MTDLKHLDFIDAVVAADLASIRDKERTYQGSWKASGGANAWHMIKRKIDRLLVMLAPLSESDRTNLKDFAENISTAGEEQKRADTCLHRGAKDGHVLVKFHTLPSVYADLLRRALNAEDIFALIAAAPSGDDGTVLAEIRDLRRYLTLVEAEMYARGTLQSSGSRATPIETPSEPMKKGPFGTTVVSDTPADLMRREKQAYEVSFPNLPSHLQNPKPLEETTISSTPLEDSNKHAERATVGIRDSVLRTDVPSGLPGYSIPKYVHHVEASVFLANLHSFSDSVRDMYFRIGDWFVLDRRKFPQEERKERFISLPLSITGVNALTSVSAWARDMYEPREGVGHEWQLAEPWREAWGPQ